jgi:acyl-CoA reductase-like NAD-dependent aldehyde dehydrogenase
MPERLPVDKTHKLYIKGAFVRAESGRTAPVHDAKGKVLAHVGMGSRKDMREAVEAARGALPGWTKRTAYNRGQIIYRMAEMMEGKRTELIEAIKATRTTKRAGTPTPAKLVDAAVDRLVCFAGWTDKLAQILGGQNPVAGPYYNFTVPEPSGVVAVVAPDEPPLLGLITLLAPAIAASNCVVAIVGLDQPLPAALLGEICATSDVPAGVVNIITADRAELAPHIAGHREIQTIVTANAPADETTILRGGAAENLKRVTVHTVRDADWFDDDRFESPWALEPFVEMKTIWHPAATS